MEDYLKKFEGKTVMVTGGAGFIGSNLVHALVPLKPKKILVVDALIPGLGGHLYNLKDIQDKIELHTGEKGDLRNFEAMKNLVRETDFIFNLAGSINHLGSLQDPANDLELNLRAHIILLEACRAVLQEKPRPLKIVFTGTRDQYGKVREAQLPINEEYLIEDVTDPQGINNHAAEFYHLWYRGLKLGIQSASIRLTNVYGPRHRMSDPGLGVLNWFIRQAMDDQNLELWDGGIALRDFIYVDDVVDALLRVMAYDTDGNVYNTGSYIKKNGLYEHFGGNIKKVQDAAKLVTEIAGKGSYTIIPYPEERKHIEPGHFYADATKIYKDTQWSPKVSFVEGVMKTIQYYQKHKAAYW